MTALELLTMLEELRDKGHDLNNIYLAATNLNDVVFADEVHNIEDVVYMKPVKDPSDYLLFQYEDTYYSFEKLSGQKGSRR